MQRLRSRGGRLRPLSPARQDAVCWEQSSRRPVQPGREAQAWDPARHLSALVRRLQPAGETSLPGGPSLPAWGRGSEEGGPRHRLVGPGVGPMGCTVGGGFKASLPWGR